ncbi:helix-turn-helix domain-containing protein [Saccharopolyspora hattusasensis]|uniref:helix-turn-helix domain-containing protein n=1 Tax=Saccharopolyspora hattusasensis TaxID=1128679 RepID=UPI003D96C03E
MRRAAGLSQHQLGELVGLTQPMVSYVESGAKRLQNIEQVARVANVLGIPARLLGFDAEPGSLDVDREVSDVERRDFLSLVLGITMTSSLHPDIARLSEILPAQSDSTRRRRLGSADAQAIEHMTEGFRSNIFARGGELMHSAALAQLHAVRGFDDAVCTDEVRARLDLASADLAWVTGWASWDIDDHDQAQKLWAFALNRAKRAEHHPRSTDLTIGVLLDAAYQSLQRRQARTALRLVEHGVTIANTSAHEASASAHADLHANRAWCHAALGNATKCRDALSEETDAFARTRPETVPPWARHVTAAEIASHRAHALALLAHAQPTYVPAAIEELASVVNNTDLTFARTRAIHLPDLAAHHFHVGDVTTGIEIGQQAIATVGELSSRHARERLRAIAKAAEPVAATSSEVTELCAAVYATVDDIPTFSETR